MTSSNPIPTTILAIRPATPEDAGTVARLAALDSAAAPAGALLLGVVDGRPLAALSVDTDDAVADPFAPTAELVGMLRERAARIRAAACTPAVRSTAARRRTSRGLRRGLRPAA